MSNLEFNNLVLLIGTNPLPNYVILYYFRKKCENLNVVFIDTVKTHNFSENIINITNFDRKHVKFIHLDEEDDPLRIENNLRDGFEKIQDLYGIHLNYTGGTKVMGTRVFTVLDEICKKKSINFSSSYLSARDFKLRINTINNQTEILLKDEIEINYAQLINLHNFLEIRKDEHNITEISYFEEMVIKKNFEEYFNIYKRNQFLNKKGNLISTKKELNDKFSNGEFSINNYLIENIINRLPIVKRIFNADGTIKNDCNFTDSNIKTLFKYLDGDWFEEYVCKNLKNAFADIYEIITNIRLTKEHWGKNEFEIDALLIRGYQLIGISITTSRTIGLCKSKGFEIMHRTKQLGGDESKQVLVTLLSDEKVAKLELDFEYDTGNSQKILVLGINDIYEGKFIQKIKQFMEV